MYFSTFEGEKKMIGEGWQRQDLEAHLSNFFEAISFTEDNVSQGLSVNCG